MVVGDDVVVLVTVVGMVGVVKVVSTIVVAADIVVVAADIVVDTADDSVSFNAYMVNGTIIPDATSTIMTSNPINK